MKEKETKTLQQTADALLQTAVTISVTVPARNWYEKGLVKLKLQETKKTFQIKPLVLGSLIRVSKLLLSIDNNLLTKEVLDDKFRLFNINYELMLRHSEALAEIVAIAVTNEKKEPPQSLVNFFLYHLEAKELLRVFSIVLSQMDITSFTASIISVRGLNLLSETNPSTQGSQIAPGTLSAG